MKKFISVMMVLGLFIGCGSSQPASVRQQTSNSSTTTISQSTVNSVKGPSEIIIVFQHSYRKHNKDFGLAIIVDGNNAGYVRTGGMVKVPAANGTRAISLKWAEYVRNKWKLDRGQKDIQVNCNNDATIITITAKSFTVNNLDKLNYNITKSEKGSMDPKPGESVILVDTKLKASAIIVGAGIQSLFNKLHVYIDGNEVYYEKTNEGAKIKVQNGFHLITIVDDKIISNVVPFTANSNRISFLARRGGFGTWELTQVGIEAIQQGNQAVQEQKPVTQSVPQDTSSDYFVSINGQPKGPYSFNELKVLAQQGQLRQDTLVWKEGMPQWATAGSVSELGSIFPKAPPPLPPR